MNMSEIMRFGIFSRLPKFELPGLGTRAVWLLPVSGGSDSSALAILLHYLFPQVDWRLVFTDTLAEPQSTYESLDKLEKFLGKKIDRIKPEMGLFELIEHYGGFLPGAQSRWCTRELKLKTFQKWIAQFDGIQKYVFVGIRADESGRMAFTLDECETVMPFVDMGVKRGDVFAILQQTIGIASFYKFRTRSGCSVCPFQRRSELVGLLQEQPIEFHRGKLYEKLTPEDIAKHQPAMPLWKDSGISANWLTLPLPKEEGDIKGKKPKKGVVDLFGNSGIFIGAEFFMDGHSFGTEFIWHQRVVSYSPTKHGLTRQLDDRYRHLLATAEVYGMTPEEVREKVKFAIYYVELPSEVFNPESPTGEGYTWQQDSSYRQIEHIVGFGTRALHAEGMRQQAARKAHPLSVVYEWAEEAKAGLSRTVEETGSVVNSQWYVASEAEPELTEEEELALLPCPMCNI